LEGKRLDVGAGDGAGVSEDGRAQQKQKGGAKDEEAVVVVFHDLWEVLKIKKLHRGHGGGTEFGEALAIKWAAIGEILFF
jgi:hypothetical protein